MKGAGVVNGEPRTVRDVRRFWGKVDRSGECWVWSGEVNNRGYGRFEFWVNDRRVRIMAHRFAFLLANGEQPEVVLHRCDNPPCVRPDHLAAGTQLDNMRDSVAKGRHSPPPVHSGANHHKAKLSDDQVAEMRELYQAGGITQKALAQQFGISPPAARAILLGRFRQAATREDDVA